MQSTYETSSHNQNVQEELYCIVFFFLVYGNVWERNDFAGKVNSAYIL